MGRIRYYEAAAAHAALDQLMLVIIIHANPPFRDDTAIEAVAGMNTAAVLVAAINAVINAAINAAAAAVVVVVIIAAWRSVNQLRIADRDQRRRDADQIIVEGRWIIIWRRRRYGAAAAASDHYRLITMISCCRLQIKACNIAATIQLI
jgi:hypothetical protein